jgi:diguanylate cyclase (GGDEF)-like protein
MSTTTTPAYFRRMYLLETVARLQHDFIRTGQAGDALPTALGRILDLTTSGLALVARLVDTDEQGADPVLEAIAAVGPHVHGALPPRLGTEGPWCDVVRSLSPHCVRWPPSTPWETGFSPPLVSFLGLPLLGDSGVVGVFALANAAGGYDEECVELMKPLAAAMAPMFERQRARDRETRLEGEVFRWADMFAAAIESTGVSVITTDLEGSVEYLNPSARRLLGVPVGEDLPALNVAAFYDPFELASAAADAARLGQPCATPFDAVIAKARARDGIERRDWTFVSLGGVRAPVMVTLSALRDRTGAPTGWVIVGSDLTELRAAEAERVRAAELEGQLGVLRRRELETAKISEAYEYVSASRSLREALRVIAAFLPSIFGNPPPELLVQRATSVRTDSSMSEDDGDPQAQAGLCAIEQRDCWSLKTGQVFISEARGLRCSHIHDDGRPWVCTPLADGAGCVAVLSAPLSPDAGEVTDNEILDDNEDRARRAAGLADLARQLSGVLANLRLRKTLVEQATHDPLTGAVNRRQLEAELKLTVHRHHKTGEPFAIVLVDVDHFKKINDQFGHERGDRVLAGLGMLLRKRLRASDILARVGGEEFVILLRAVDHATTAALAESIRVSVQDEKLGGDDVTCTCSLGVVHVARLELGVDELVRRADRALYEAKAAGRNRVVFCDAQASRIVRQRA